MPPTSVHPSRPIRPLLPIGRRRRPLRAEESPRAPAGVHRYTRRVCEGRAEEPEARAPSGTGGGEADPVRPARDRAVHGDGRPEQRDRRIHHRIQLLRSDPQHHQPRAPQAVGFGRAAPPFECACRRPAAGGRLQYFAPQPVREA